MKHKNIALIVAGGSGQRFGNEIPKQYLSLPNNEVILAQTIKKFKSSELIDAVLVVIRPEDTMHYQQAVKGLELLPVCYGGITRQDSVKNGLQALMQYQPELVLVHDANRPFVAVCLIDQIMQTLKANHNCGVVPILAISDTVKRITVGNTTLVDRNDLYMVQTPQGFYFQQLRLAYQNNNQEFTDESSLMEANEIRIIYIPGDRENRKITQKEDLS